MKNISFFGIGKTAFQNRRDKLLFALALAVLAIALSRPEGKKAIAQVAPPTLEFVQWWRNDLEKDTLQNLVDEFESLHGEVNIALKDADYEDLRNRLFGFGSAGEGGVSFPGDILALDPLWIPELEKRGIVEGSGEPLLSFADVLYYNTEILAEAGFSRPPKNRSEFLACAKAVAGLEEKRWGLAMGGKCSRLVYEDAYSWIWASGAQLVKDGEPALDSRAVAESLSFLAALGREGLIVPGSFPFGLFRGGAAGSGTKLEDFVSGRAAFMIAPASLIRHARERMGDGAFGVTSVPGPDNYAGKRFFGTAAWSLGIHSASPHKEEAKLFAAFLAEKAPFLAEKARAIPVNAAGSPGLDPFYSKVWDIAISGESAQDFAGLAEERALAGIFGEELGALFAGQSSPEEAAAAIQTRWLAALKPPAPGSGGIGGASGIE